MLASTELLVHFDPEKDLILSCDASPLWHRGSLVPQDGGMTYRVQYASQSLAPAEKLYSQLDKEGLAIIFAVKKFHQYLCGRTSMIHSDCKPATFIW